jgi:hypothetical protein
MEDCGTAEGRSSEETAPKVKDWWPPRTHPIPWTLNSQLTSLSYISPPDSVSIPAFDTQCRRTRHLQFSWHHYRGLLWMCFWNWGKLLQEEKSETEYWVIQLHSSAASSNSNQPQRYRAQNVQGLTQRPKQQGRGRGTDPTDPTGGQCACKYQ